MIKRLLVLAATAAILTGCYHAAKPTPTPVTTTPQQQTLASEEMSVEIKGFAFNPQQITVKPGAKITVTNQDSVGHTFTADDGKSFNIGIINQGQSATITAPTVPGSYAFHCTPHPYMKGTLVVAQ